MDKYAVVTVTRGGETLGYSVIDATTGESMLKPNHFYHTAKQAQENADKLNGFTRTPLTYNSPGAKQMQAATAHMNARRAANGEPPALIVEAVEPELTCDHAGNPDDPCDTGPVEYRMSNTRTQRSSPLCARHQRQRLDRMREIDARYPDSDSPPEWFDESYAGERWDDDY